MLLIIKRVKGKTASTSFVISATFQQFEYFEDSFEFYKITICIFPFLKVYLTKQPLPRISAYDNFVKDNNPKYQDLTSQH